MPAAGRARLHVSQALHGISLQPPYLRRRWSSRRSTPRLGLSVPYEWWPSAPSLKEIEAAGFAWVQVPAPPSVGAARPARRRPATPAGSARRSGPPACAASLHGPGSLQVGSPDGDRAMEGLLSYAAEAGADLVVYHAANFPDQPASEDKLLAETRSLARAARIAERLGVTIAIENLAPVFPGPDALSLHAQRAADDGEPDRLPRARPLPRHRPRQRGRRPAPDRPDGADRARAQPHGALPPARQPRRPPRRRHAARARPAAPRPAPAAGPRLDPVAAPGAAAARLTPRPCCWRFTRRARPPRPCTRARSRRWAEPPTASPPS